MEQVIFFGAGKILNRTFVEKKNLLDQRKIVAVIDNNPLLWGRRFGHYTVESPEKIACIKYDLIVITISKPDEVYRQLIKLGVDSNKIMTFFQFWRLDCHKIISKYGNKFLISRHKMNIVLITQYLGYSGAPIAILNAAKAMKKAGYNILLATSDVNENVLKDTITEGISIWVMPGLDAPGQEEKEWVSKFDYVIINSFVMIPCVYEFQDIRPILWWLHESSYSYPSTIQLNPQYGKECLDSRVQVLAVSNFAKKCFEKYYPERVNGILPVAIPDLNKSVKHDRNDRFIFAYVGAIVFYKGVHIIIDAIDILKKRGIDNIELWIIGISYDDLYGEEIQSRCQKFENIKMLGECTQYEMEKYYEEIDVIICASFQETLSIACIDAMKHEKICLVSEGVGITEYLSDDCETLVFKTNDSDELADKMIWTLNHKTSLKRMGKHFREVYLKYFTYEVFANKVSDILRKLE